MEEGGKGNRESLKGGISKTGESLKRGISKTYQTHCKQKPLSSSSDHAPTEFLTLGQ